MLNSTGTKKLNPEQATEVEVREFRRADASYKKHNLPQALKDYTAFVQRYPGTNLTDQALFNIGQIYYDQGDFFRAARYWLAIVDGQMVSPNADRALVGAAISQSQIGHYDDALNLLARFKITETTDKALASQAMELYSKLNLQKGNNIAALQNILVAIGYRTKPNEKQNLMNRAVEIVNGNLAEKDLESVISSSEFASLELPARFRLAQSLYDRKEWSAARSQFSTIVSKFPATEEAKKSQIYISTLDAQEKSDSTVIGAVLPLTGKDSQAGYKVLHGIQMGLGIFNQAGSSPLKLAVIDSEGNPDVARRGVERLVSEDHAIAIIGDLISKTAQAVATKAQELGVSCLTLSQKQGLTDIGDFVFRNNSTPEAQMRSLVDIAMGSLGYKKFAILYPNEGYGTTYASLFWDHVLARGGQITAAQNYEPGETDFRDPIQRLIGTYYVEEDRGKELQLRTTEWQKDQTTKAQEAQKDGKKLGPQEKIPKDLLPPIIDFDAIFIPDDPKTVGQIAAMLAYNDVNKMPLLGTDLWDNPQIVVRGEKHVENSLFVDSFFNSDESPTMKKFTSDFQSKFGYAPGVFEAQGYDSARLLADILKNYNYSISRTGLRDKLAETSNVVGATGPLRMSPLREVEKSLVPLTVLNGKIVKFITNGGTPQ